MKGQIIKIIAGFFDIENNDKIYRVRGSGNLRNYKITPIVGDFVEFTPDKFLLKVYPRKNFFTRPKVANIDQAMIIMSLKNPRFSPFLLDKFLAIVESKEILPIIILTKIDLDVNHSWKKDYQSQGYQVFEVNNLHFKNNLLKKLFFNKTSVFIGQSGVGKSNTINNIANLNLDTQEISSYLKRGKHTTRVVEIINFAGGKLIDTPGFSTINFDLKKLELARSFHDFRKLSADCQFAKNCLHHYEKKCAIKNAVVKNIILLSRYESYLKLLKEAK